MTVFISDDTILHLVLQIKKNEVPKVKTSGLMAIKRRGNPLNARLLPRFSNSPSCIAEIIERGDAGEGQLPDTRKQMRKVRLRTRGAH